MPIRSLAADDIFISYTRLDASTYAAGLADELTKKGFSCFIDKLGTDPNKDLPDMLRRKVKSCAMLVVVGTERAATRKTIADEVAEFLQTGRGSSIVPIDFGGAVYRADWYPLVEGIAPEPEKNAQALDDGEPSPSVLSRIEKQFNYTRRNQRLRRAAVSMAVVFALLLLAGVGAGVYARQQIVLASAERQRALEAREAADKARSDAETERKAALQAKKDADDARTEATEQRKKADEAAGRADEAARREQVARELEAQATANARLQETIGSSRAKATAALRFGEAEPDHALTQSLEAYRVHPTVEARGSLLESLERYPNLSGLTRGNPNPIVSLASCHNGAVAVSSDDRGLILFWDVARKRVLKRIEPRADDPGVRVTCARAGSLCAADDLGGQLTAWEVAARGEEYEVIQRMSEKSLTNVNIPVQITPVFAARDLLVGVTDVHQYRRTTDVFVVDLSQPSPKLVPKTLTVPREVTVNDLYAARAMTANPATKLIAVGFNHGVALWQIDALDKPATWLREPEEWKATRETIVSMSFSPDGNFLAVGVDREHVAVWDLTKDEPEIVNSPLQGVGTFVALFNPSMSGGETTHLLTAKRNGEMSLWDVWNYDRPIWNTSFKPAISILSLMSDTGAVATGTSDGLLATWDMDRESRLRMSLPGVEWPRALAFGRNTGLLYLASNTKSEGDTASKLWRKESGRYELLSPRERPRDFPAGEFGLQLLSDTSPDIRLRDVYASRPDEIHVDIKHTFSAPRAISPDGRTFAIGNSASRSWVESTSIIVWDISDKAHPRRLNSLEFDGRPVSLSFGEDGATLASSYDNGRIVLWDYLKGTKRRQFLVPASRNSGAERKFSAGKVALSPDGRLLAAKSDGPISLWDVETGLLLGRLGPDPYPFGIGGDFTLGSMVFSRDGKTLIVTSAGNNAELDLWNLDAEVWAALAANITGGK